MQTGQIEDNTNNVLEKLKKQCYEAVFNVWEMIQSRYLSIFKLF